MTFFYDAEGNPTSVEDRNGNRLAFTLELVPPAERRGGATKRIVQIADAAGVDGNPDRGFELAYYGPADAPQPEIRAACAT